MEVAFIRGVIGQWKRNNAEQKTEDKEEKGEEEEGEEDEVIIRSSLSAIAGVISPLTDRQYRHPWREFLQKPHQSHSTL